MPHVDVHGTRVYYEEYGAGFPVLLLAPGGFTSAISSWSRYPYNPITELAAHFRVIAMDQRGTGQSYADFGATGWDSYTRDQIGVLDALGIDSCFAIGGCIGCSYVFNLIRLAPGRVAAAVPMNPIGENGGPFDGYIQMFENAAAVAETRGMAAVVQAARANPSFAAANDGGPWANRIAVDDAFARQIAALDPETYASACRVYGGMFRGSFVYAVDEAFIGSCRVPMQIYAGNDAFHPMKTSERLHQLAPKSELVIGWREDAATPGAILRFLQEHIPA